MKLTHSVLMLFFLHSGVVHADCTDIIALSKVRTDVVQDSASLNAEARNFCKEYASAKSSGSTMNIGASYNGIGGSLGSGNVSAEQTASKYCDASDESKARSDAYRQYVETIAPGAYSAYMRCEELNKSGIRITIPPDGILPKTFKATVSFASDSMGAQQEIAYSISDGVSCGWDRTDKNPIAIAGNSTVVLSCRREADAENSVVLIYATSKPESQLAFRWTAYQNGAPVDLVKQLVEKIDQAVAAAAKEAKLLRRGVVPFALNTCPDGWAEYPLLYGRFVRGIDRGTGADPDGARSVGSLQMDQYRAHTHTRPRDVYDAGQVGLGSVPGGTDLGYGFTASGNGVPPDTGSSGGAETRPKNISLLYCVKN